MQHSSPGRGPGATVRWLGPLPVWTRPSPAGLRLREEAGAGRPAILRFDHDDFMQEYLDTLAGEPGRLGEWLAQPETWRDPMPSPRPTAPAATPAASQAAFLIDKVHREAAARKPAPSQAVNLRSRPDAPVPAITPAAESPLKLYQATHKRHYLISASLICEEPGLPDCLPEPGHQEKVSFVLRRLLPPEQAEKAALAEWDEYAFVNGAQGSRWQRLGDHGAAGRRGLAPGEEQLPLFPVSYLNCCDQSRRLFSGVIPVSRREQWVGATIGGDVEAGSEPATAASEAGGRSVAAMLLQAEVVAPWKTLLEQAEFKLGAADLDFPNFGSNADARANDRRRLLRTSRDELQTGAWYVLLDFARLLRDQLPAVWQVLTGAAEASGLDDGEAELVAVLRATTLSRRLASAVVTVPLTFPLRATPGRPRGSTGRSSEDSRYGGQHLRWNLAEALVAALAAEAGLERVETTFTRYDEQGDRLPIDPDWPDFLFPLADPELEPPVPAVRLAGLVGLERRQKAVDALAEMVERLLPPPEAGQRIETVPVGDARQAWFVVRCVYERRHCGPLFPIRVSAPSRIFQMAPFFDPDAPTRPVRIPMPLDVSPAGLRKFQRNTGFVISDMLCGQIKRIRKMTLGNLVLSVLPWPFHKSLPDPGKTGPCKDSGGSFGMICSLSIPIVTLCALILMMIIVALFDLFFRWIPYLFTCLPIPGLKGKGGGGTSGSGGTG